MKSMQLVLFIIILAAGAVALYFSLNKKGTSEEMNTATYSASQEPRIGYVELQVSDLARSLIFYEELIGFTVIEKDERTATLTADGVVPQLILREEESYVPRPVRTTGLYHFAILVPTRQDLALSLVHLADSGYPLQGASDHQYSEALYLSDPDDNGIEIYTDRNSNEWQRDNNGGYVGATKQLVLEGLLAEIKDAEWTGLPSGTRIGHIHLQASDLKASEHFYVETLGLDIVAKNAHMLFVSKDAYHHHIGMNTWSGQGLPKPPEHSLGLKQFTLHFTQEEYDRALAKLEQSAYSYRADNHEMTVTDPSGNSILIFVKE
ncbi:glyoxalase [Paenibacillus sambharensis]|uniref:Glyoxalase n=1 Tax=Paenibacillus sambharensis TaxID=1803190 RepID=A0A2W1L6Z1_9BACL|nr:VOC family protein [Paenibacillus sambharensis]PZD94723.1 glyoxalase [Paenibacillus sambharensis]